MIAGARRRTAGPGLEPRLHEDAGHVVRAARLVGGVDERLRRAPEIAGAMLQRQQAAAIIAARRKIVEGAKRVKVLGEDIAVAADVYTIGGLSAHADREDLLAWAGGYEAPPGTVLVAHGEESVSVEFAGTLRSRLGWNAEVPVPGTPVTV